MTEELVLNNGVTMPALGLRVFQSPPEETAAAVETALNSGRTSWRTRRSPGSRPGTARRRPR
jgi:diketogulonate reductase-like aldo/keto reductase